MVARRWSLPNRAAAAAAAAALSGTNDDNENSNGDGGGAQATRRRSLPNRAAALSGTNNDNENSNGGGGGGAQATRRWWLPNRAAALSGTNDDNENSNGGGGGAQATRRWSFPNIAAAAAALSGTNDDNEDSNGGGGGAQATTAWRPRRRASAPTLTPESLRAAEVAEAARAHARWEAEQARLAARREEQIRQAQIYEQLSAHFGEEFSEVFLIPVEVCTVASTRSSDLPEGADEEEAVARRNAPRRAARHSTRSETSTGVYALDPDTGLPLPVATPVGVEMSMRQEELYDFFRRLARFLLLVSAVTLCVFAVLTLLRFLLA